MKTYVTVKSIQRELSLLRHNSKTIAFVPTMGALHEGHISLIGLAKKHADTAVCSIFVNPSQFNNTEDLQKYPRTLDLDLALLKNASCDLVFTPAVEEIYPSGLMIKPELNLAHLDKVMEGHFRPGHFDGMLMVVKRLLDIVNPDFLIMGQKDFQQYSLVSMMIRQLSLPYQMIIGDTLREADGLAMSSRNRRLTPEFRIQSKIIYQALLFCQQSINSFSDLSQLGEKCIQLIDSKGLRTEYFNLVDGDSLLEVSDSTLSQKIVACVAAWAGDVRLIDNLIVKG